VEDGLFRFDCTSITGDILAARFNIQALFWPAKSAHKSRGSLNNRNTSSTNNVSTNLNCSQNNYCDTSYNDYCN